METVACHLISVHNIAFQVNFVYTYACYYQIKFKCFNERNFLLLQMRLMRTMRENIENGTFPQFVNKFVNELYSDGNYPPWVVSSLNSVGIKIIRE